VSGFAERMVIAGQLGVCARKVSDEERRNGGATVVKPSLVETSRELFVTRYALS